MTTKQHIIAYLRSQGGWTSGTELENQSLEWATKASTISRRARELADEGKIWRSLGYKKRVQYRIRPPKPRGIPYPPIIVPAKAGSPTITSIPIEETKNTQLFDIKPTRRQMW